MIKFVSKKRGGDTIIEVLLALTILTALITVGMTSALRSYRLANLARERTVAFNLGTTQADALRSFAASYTWDDTLDPARAASIKAFTDSDRLGGIIYKWTDSTAFGYPSAGGLDPTTFTIKYIDTPANGFATATSKSKNMFFMQNVVGTGWQLSTTPVLKQTTTGNTYYIYIVPNRANPCVSDSTGKYLSNNLIRFDIYVRWINAISKAENTSTQVIYLSRTEGEITSSGPTPTPGPINCP